MRCFVALWPDDAVRTRLDEIARAWHREFPRARRMRSANLHLTLAFIGEIDAETAHRVAATLARSTWTAVPWRIDRIGVFDRARVLWAGSGDDPQLTETAARVRALLDDLRVRYDRKPFAPHVTLLRNLPRAAHGTAQVLAPAIDWPTQRPVLLQSLHAEDGTRYAAVEAGAN